MTCNLDINLQSLQYDTIKRGNKLLGFEILFLLKIKIKEKVYISSLKHLEHVKSSEEIISSLLE